MTNNACHVTNNTCHVTTYELESISKTSNSCTIFCTRVCVIAWAVYCVGVCVFSDSLNDVTSYGYYIPSVHVYKKYINQEIYNQEIYKPGDI